MHAIALVVSALLAADEPTTAPPQEAATSWREAAASPEAVEGHEIHWYRTLDMALGLRVDAVKGGGKTAVSLSEYGKPLFSVPDILAAPERVADGRVRILVVEPDPPLLSTTLHDRYVVIADTRREVLFMLSFAKKDGRFTDDVSPQAVAEMRLYLDGVARQQQPPEPPAK